MSCKINGLTCNFAVVKSKSGVACAPFRLDGAETCLFDSIASEQVAISGTPIQFWHQDIESAVRDPLYDEPISRAWLGPFTLMAFVEFAPNSTEAREEGTRATWTGSIWVPRTSLEQAGSFAPEPGDVIRYWSDVGFFNAQSVLGANEPGSGYYFDVTNVSTDGHLFDSSKFIGFKLDVSRRTEFSPERRLRE